MFQGTVIMNKSLIAAWAISLGAAFYLGMNLRPDSDSVNKSNSQEKTLKENGHQNSSTVAADDSSGEARRLNANPVRKKVPVNIVMADLKALLGDTGMMSMDMAALAESYYLVKDLDEEDLLEALSQLQGNLNNPGNLLPLMLILGRYAELNPQNAMAFYENNITSPQAKMVALSGILSSWAKTDPEGAYEWFQNKGDKDNSGGMMGGNSFSLVYIFQGLAKKDLNGAIEKLKSVGDESFKLQMAVSGVASSLRTKEDFIEFMEKVPEFKNKNAGRTVIQNWVMRNPEEAVAWVDGLEDKKRQKELSKNVFNGWMMTEPQKAAEWYMGKAEGDDRQMVANNIASSWGMSNPEASIAWLEKQEGVDTQKSLKAIYSSAIYNNPVYVADNLEKLSAEKDRKEISLQLYQQLKNVNKDKAQEFFDKSPYKEELKKTPTVNESIDFFGN